MGILVNQCQYQVSRPSISPSINSQVQSTITNPATKPEQSISETQILTTHNGQISDR